MKKKLSDQEYVDLANYHFGSAIRDNTRDQKIAIGKGIEDGSIENEE